MKPVQGGVAGILTGLLFGCAICLFQNIPMTDSLLRIFILTAAGGWMGMLLAWLNQILPKKTPVHHEQTEHRS